MKRVLNQRNSRGEPGPHMANHPKGQCEGWYSTLPDCYAFCVLDRGHDGEHKDNAGNWGPR